MNKKWSVPCGMGSSHRIVLLSVGVLIAGCAAQRVIQPAAGGLPPSRVATIATTGKRPQNGVLVSLKRVTDAGGKDVVNYNLATADIRDTVIVTPGSYQVQVICVWRAQDVQPSGKFDLRGGYTYVFDCRRDGLRVQLMVTEIATATTP
jgi:hypothetical protein